MPESGSPLQRTLDRYLETLALTQRPGTVRVNRTFLRGFLRHLAIYHPALSSFSQLQREHIEVWSRHLAAKHPAISNTTRRKYLIAVRIFFERLWAWGWEEAPVEGLIRRHDLPMEDKCLPKCRLSEILNRFAKVPRTVVPIKHREALITAPPRRREVERGVACPVRSQSTGRRSVRRTSRELRTVCVGESRRMAKLGERDWRCSCTRIPTLATNMQRDW